jgi:hypothetical protein
MRVLSHLGTFRQEVLIAISIPFLPPHPLSKLHMTVDSWASWTPPGRIPNLPLAQRYIFLLHLQQLPKEPSLTWMN